MKLRKIIAALAASAVAVSAMAITASAASYTATLGFADSTWAAQDWASTCEITGDGTYSITSNCLFNVVDEDTGDEIQEPAAGTGAVVFVVDIAQLGADLGLNAAPEGASDEDDSWKYATGDVKVTDVKVTSGATEFAVDQSKVKVGDIESKGNLRIEIYNEYGPTKDAPSIDVGAFAFAAEDQFTVTFTITGLDAPAAAEDTATEETTTEAPAAGDVAAETETSKGSPDTGVEDAAVVAGLAIVAAGAVLVSKKRK